MERETGFEPATSWLGTRGSTTELLPLVECSLRLNGFHWDDSIRTTRSTIRASQVSLRKPSRSSGSCACARLRGGYTGVEMSEVDETTSEAARPSGDSGPLYFFPDREITEEEVRAILSSDDQEQRAWAISHMLRYAQWDDIWTYVDRDEVREIFADLDLPENLRSAWARMLKIEAPVG